MVLSGTMKNPTENSVAEERLVALYVELTGASESLARSVIIHLDLYRTWTPVDARLFATESAVGIPVLAKPGDGRISDLYGLNLKPIEALG